MNFKSRMSIFKRLISYSTEIASGDYHSKKNSIQSFGDYRNNEQVLKKLNKIQQEKKKVQNPKIYYIIESLEGKKISQTQTIDTVNMIFLGVFLAILGVINAVEVKKIEGINESVKSIIVAPNGYTFVVTENGPKDRMYYISPENILGYSADFNSIVAILPNDQDEAYILDFIQENNSIDVWFWNPSGPPLTKKTNFERLSTGFSFFADKNGNLFYNGPDAVYVWRQNEKNPVTISNINGLSIVNNKTYAIGQDGSVYLGLHNRTKPDGVKVAVIPFDTLYSSEPFAYPLNMNFFNEFTEMAAFQGNIYFATYSALVQLRDDSQYFLNGGYTWFGKLTATERGFSLRSGIANECYLSVLTTPDYQIKDVERFFDSCDYYQAFDGQGNLYVADIVKSTLCYAKVNENNCTNLDIPNTLYIKGLAVTENRDIWILAQNLYVIPRNSTKAIKVTAPLHAVKEWPVKFRVGLDQVLIGQDCGLYVATV